MNLKLLIAQFYIPAAFKRKKIFELYLATAQAFGVTEQIPNSKNINELLTKYALFTKEHADKLINSGMPTVPTQEKLYDSAFKIGSALRQELSVKSYADFCVAARAVYRALKIDFQCTQEREVIISRCFFSEHYSAKTCELISSLDCGLIAGLSGGGKLQFHERITENKPCCIARIQI